MADQTISGGNAIKGNCGNRLIEALEHFIVPLIQGTSVHYEGDASELASDATNLLAALQKFIISLAANNTLRERAVADTDPYPAAVDSITSPVPPQRPPLLELILEKARHRVFNQMPIRMLSFNVDGTGIRLAERSEVLRIVSERIKDNFYTDDATKVDQDSEESLVAIDEFLDRHCAYAILSHTWLRESPGEVTFTDWTTKTFDPRLNGYRKLEMFCRVAALNHGMTLGWMDTCCIDKSSSAELDESIRSMFRWYESSAVCITYLADTMTLEDMHKDTWFTRGWTLQELIAPQMAKFYCKDWACLASNSPKELDDKGDKAIAEEIHKATTITRIELDSTMKFISISRRMQWAAERNVTKEEDTAYSLMGIFDVSFSTAYGEGAEAAFGRLVREILNANQAGSQTLDIVNWGHGTDQKYRFGSVSVLIPESPKYYVHGVSDILWYEPYEPILSTPLGLRVPVLVMPGLRAETAQAMFIPRGNYYAKASVVGRFHSSSSVILTEDSSQQRGVYNVLDTRLFNTDGKLAFTRPSVAREDSDIQIFGVLNFAETNTIVDFPNSNVCFAVALLTVADVSVRYDGHGFWAATMASPITFRLQALGNTGNNYKILKHDLHKHGITLTTMYL